MTVEAGSFLLQELEAQYERLRGKDALWPLRQKAWEKFQLMGLPGRHDEAYRHVPLRDAYACCNLEQETLDQQVFDSTLEAAILPECRKSYLVFIDGALAPERSNTSLLPHSVVLVSLSQAVRSHGHFLLSHLHKTIKEETDPFALLNLALHPQGLFLYIPPKQHLEAPIQCIYATTGQALFSASRMQIVVGKDSECSACATSLFLSKNSCITSHAVDFLLEEKTHLSFVDVQKSPSEHLCFHHLRAHLKRDATFKMVDFFRGLKVMRKDIYVQCAGENSEADLKGLAMLQDNLCAHTHVIVEHTAPHTRSMQRFKGLLRDASQSSFKGKILVRPVAQKTEAYQLNAHLLLGHAAIAHSKPHLEIFADDVKASHGSTVAHLEQAQLFYLKSRGIDEASAKQLLIDAFCREILDEIPPNFRRGICG